VNLDTKLFLESAREILNQGAHIRFRAQGFSMTPFIKDGDVIQVKPAKASHMSVGDIAFYSGSDGFAVAHRVIGKEKEGQRIILVTRPDMPSDPPFDRVKEEGLLGKVIIVERRGKRKRVDRGLLRILGLCCVKWPTLLPKVYQIRMLIRELPELFDSRFLISSPEESLESVVKKYDDPKVIKAYSQSPAKGLNEQERYMVNKYMDKKGKVLVIGCGGGREAIALRRLGHKVTGIDFVPGMIEQAMQNAKRNGLDINFEVRSATELHYPSYSFDYVFFSETIFSNIPTRRLRIKVLRDTKRILKPEGVLFFSVYYRPKDFFYWLNIMDNLRWLASIFKGNFGSQLGDAMRRARVAPVDDSEKLCFYHYFSGYKKVLRELKSAGLIDIEEKDSYWAAKPTFSESRRL